MTSVFPSTTATAMAAFMTGVPAQQHALTDWFMYLKEIGMVTKILPFVSRSGTMNLGEADIKFKDIFNQGSFFQDIKAPSFVVKNKDYIFSDTSRAFTQGAKKMPFSSLSDFFEQLRISVKSKRRKFVFAYWDKFDLLCHEIGVDSEDVSKHFWQLDKKFACFSKLVKNLNATVIVTADHGLINRNEEETILLRDHPKLAETLVLPLCGEPRAVYCYVYPEKVEQFEIYIKKNFGAHCRFYRSRDLIARNYFGLFIPNEKLHDRVGDYTVIMNKDYIMKDFVLGEKRRIHKGMHGGTSKGEIIVPLIVF